MPVVEFWRKDTDIWVWEKKGKGWGGIWALSEQFEMRESSRGGGGGDWLLENVDLWKIEGEGKFGNFVKENRFFELKMGGGRERKIESGR